MKKVPKEGDRVRVVCELTGRVTSINGAHADLTLEGVGMYHIARLPLHVLSVIHPPVKVLDVIETAEQLDALPPGSAVLFGDHRIAKRYGRDWYETASELACLVAELIPAKVLLLPEGAA